MQFEAGRKGAGAKTGFSKSEDNCLASALLRVFTFNGSRAGHSSWVSGFPAMGRRNGASSASISERAAIPATLFAATAPGGIEGSGFSDGRALSEATRVDGFSCLAALAFLDFFK